MNEDITLRKCIYLRFIDSCSDKTYCEKTTNAWKYLYSPQICWLTIGQVWHRYSMRCRVKTLTRETEILELKECQQTEEGLINEREIALCFSNFCISYRFQTEYSGDYFFFYQSWLILHELETWHVCQQVPDINGFNKIFTSQKVLSWTTPKTWSHSEWLCLGIPDEYL